MLESKITIKMILIANAVLLVLLMISGFALTQVYNAKVVDQVQDAYNQAKNNGDKIDTLIREIRPLTRPEK